MKTNVKKRSKLVAGIDEAGRGPLAGPVVAAAVILPEKHFIVGLRDSKKLSQKKRKILYKKIKKESISVGIGIIGVETIDKLNIKEATIYAMKAAVKNLKVKPDKLLIDGFPLDTQEIPNEGIIRGDDLIDSIKAASIIAKETRENEISKLKGKIGDFGSGYPSDERTIKFLKSFYADNGKWPTGTRKSWKTVERIRPVKTLDDFGEHND